MNLANGKYLYIIRLSDFIRCKFFNINSTIFKFKSIFINLEKKGTTLCLLGNMLLIIQ